MDEEGGYASPEEAAVSGWAPAAQARVLEVRYEGDTAFVLVDTEPSQPMSVCCERRSDGTWEWVTDTNA